MMYQGTIRVSRGGVTRAKRAIKEAAKAGGHWHVEIDHMYPTSEYDARKLVMMARGARERDIEHWRSCISEREAASRRYDRRSFADYAGQAERIRENGPECYYKPIPGYEERMAAWAAGVAEREEQQRARIRAEYRARIAALDTAAA